jgi:hypothetical protein
MLQQSLHQALQNAVGLPLRAFLGALQSNHRPLSLPSRLSRTLSLSPPHALRPRHGRPARLSPLSPSPLSDSTTRTARPRSIPVELRSTRCNSGSAGRQHLHRRRPPSLPCWPAAEIESGGGDPTSTRATPAEEAGSTGGPPSSPEHDGDPRPPPPSPARRAAFPARQRRRRRSSPPCCFFPGSVAGSPASERRCGSRQGLLLLFFRPPPPSVLPQAHPPDERGSQLPRGDARGMHETAAGVPPL